MLIPDDFPRGEVVASLADAQPKLSVRLDANSGKYVSTRTDSYVQERYEVCADLVSQLVEKCRANRATKYAAMSEAQIMERLLAQLLGTSWGSPGEMAWVIRATAAELSWPIPKDAAVLSTLIGGAP
jgi:hypothetical protein